MRRAVLFRFVTIVLVVVAQSGCVTVPSRSGLARVRVGDVVKRIKCDLAKSVFYKAQERTPDGRHPFVFLADWAAKIHLTIAIDDTVGVNPGATVTTPLDRTVATTFFPATTETFSLGIGAGLSTEAIRQEDIEFLISFSDLITEFQKPAKRELYNNCELEPGVLLESDLDFASLVNASLEPVEIGVLRQGNNVGPGVPPPAIPAAQLRSISNRLKELRDAATGIPSPNALVNMLKVYQEDAALEETRTQSIINNIVKPLYAISSAALEPACLTKATQSQFQAITWSTEVSLNVINVNQATNEDDARTWLGKVKDDKKKVIDFTKEMIAEIRACSEISHKPKKPPPPAYDPVNLISETVTFYVTTSGSLTPSWKLVKITAPLAPTFLSGSRKDTNTLILAMGRPQVNANGTITSTQAMDQQVLAAILSQAVSSRPITITP